MPGARKAVIQRGLKVSDLEDSAAVARLIRQALGEAQVVCLEGPGFSESVFRRWRAIVPLLGTLQASGEDGATGQSNGSVWNDVRYDPAQAHTFRHSATPQPLHTDSAYGSDPADLVFFICEHPAINGGDTIFSDAELVEETVCVFDRALHTEMWTLPLAYGKAGIRGRTLPVMRRDREGLLINWNYYRVLEETAAAQQFRRRFFTFLQEEVVARGKVEPVRLRPGEVAVFHDQRVLHGRFAFEPSPRCLWKCSLNLESC